MFGHYPVIFGSLAALLVTSVVAVDQTKDATLVAKLKTAATALDQQALLQESDYLFDYNKEPNWSWQPGSVVNGNAARFPAAAGHGLTVAFLNLGPCAQLPPHFHPRATNFVVAVQGTTKTYMYLENGARPIEQTLTPGKMTIFPTASLHTMENVGCENAQLVSALNSEDTGTTNVANALFALDAQRFLNPALGYPGFDLNKTASSIPPVGHGSIAGNKECLARCAKSKQRRGERNA